MIIFTVEAKGYVETDPDVIRFRSLPIGLGTELAFGLVNQARVNQIIQSENIQLVHSHTEFNLCVSAMLVARKFNLPEVPGRWIRRAESHVFRDRYDQQTG